MATAKESFNLDAMASEIMFTGRVSPDAHGVQYRQGKTVEDVKKALAKARNPKNGMGKVEFELNMLELYLRTEVFKRKAATTASNVQVA